MIESNYQRRRISDLLKRIDVICAKMDIDEKYRISARDAISKVVSLGRPGSGISVQRDDLVHALLYVIVKRDSGVACSLIKKELLSQSKPEFINKQSRPKFIKRLIHEIYDMLEIKNEWKMALSRQMINDLNLTPDEITDIKLLFSDSRFVLPKSDPGSVAAALVYCYLKIKRPGITQLKISRIFNRTQDTIKRHTQWLLENNLLANYRFFAEYFTDLTNDKKKSQTIIYKKKNKRKHRANFILPHDKVNS